MNEFRKPQNDWQSMGTAPRNGDIFHGIRRENGAWGKPFYSFWSRETKQFFGEPTHWAPLT